ncbi:MAG: two-component system OmpR family sensor histidine kinase QseC [Rhodospirillaceae bacterium]|nr:MAG: two-component system OmpR family sensor histidine kinase QseC [Rhodospirillaceae bacterium]
MTSIRARLFLILIVTTGLVWLSAVAWTYFSTRAEVERVLDARLTEAARMVSSLITSQEINVAQLGARQTAIAATPHAPYDRQLSCQIWSFDGSLVGRSDGAPAGPLSDHNAGFSETRIDGQIWRVYAVENPELGARILVGDNLRIRDRLVGDVIKGLVLPASLIMPILAGLIWASVGGGLAPLNRMATALKGRSASDLSPLANNASAAEIRPVISALNDLFTRVADARERERNFTAFAAHELRTPLAGLKTQAQVALASNDSTIRDKALTHIVLGVDQTSRLVRQLLDVAEIEAREPDPAAEISPGEALSTIADDLLAHQKPGSRIVIDHRLFEVRLSIQSELFMLAARNLLENALAYSPIGGIVRCGLVMNRAQTCISIDDEGPGIPADELSRVSERFFRGRHKTAVGSGLGLSIAELALGRADASLRLVNKPEGGLRAEIVIGSDRVRKMGDAQSSN